MIKAGLCGYYGDEKTPANGQTIRTTMVTEALKKYGTDIQLTTLSYHNWKRKPIRTAMNYIHLFRQSDIMILFPDENAVKVLIPLSNILNFKHKKRMYYVVIGGWLPVVLNKHSYLCKAMKRLDALFVQTNVLKQSLKELGITKVKIFPNFKEMELPELKEFFSKAPYPICFASRVTLQKGIFELIEVIREINKKECRYILDIYGPIDIECESEFYQKINDIPYISYKGIFDAHEAAAIIRSYYLHVFPTKYATEGFPGSILDSFIAGVPVIASRWNSFNDVLIEGVNALTYPFNDTEALKQTLLYAFDNSDEMIKLRKSCQESAEKYKSKNVISILIDEIHRGIHK